MKIDEDFEVMKGIDERLNNLEILMHEFAKKIYRMKVFGIGYFDSMERLSSRIK